MSIKKEKISQERKEKPHFSGCFCRLSKRTREFLKSILKEREDESENILIVLNWNPV